MSLSKRFHNKIAVITAATDGIGYAIAEKLGSQGATVVISSRKQSNVDASLKKLRAQNIKCDGIPCHAGKIEDIKNLISYTVNKYKKIDILIPQAAINPTKLDFWDVEQPQLTKMFETNVFGPFWMVKFAKDYMPNDGSASIILHSSVGSHIIWPGNGFYCISKLAINGLTKLLYQDLTPKRNIRVNCVASGAIQTKFLSSLVKSMDKADKKSGDRSSASFSYAGIDLNKISSSNWGVIKYVNCMVIVKYICC